MAHGQVYDPIVAIDGIKYALFLVDKKTCKCHIYPLKDLKESIVEALQQFVTDAQVNPKLIRTNFDKD